VVHTLMAKARRTFGKLTYSCVAKNVPEGAVRANEALIERIAVERSRNGWPDDANVAVPGPTYDAVMARQRAEKPRRRNEEE